MDPSDTPDPLTEMSLDLLDQLGRARLDVQRLEQEVRELGDARDRITALEGELNWARERALVAEEKAHQYSAEVEGARRQIAELHEQIGAVRARLGGRAAEGLAEIRAVLGVGGEANMQQVEEHLRGLTQALADRNRWISSLLSELVGRRFKLGRRELFDYEREFLEEQRPDLTRDP